MANLDGRSFQGGADVRKVCQLRAFVDVGTTEVARNGEEGPLNAGVREILLVQSARNAALLHGSGEMGGLPRASRSRALMAGVVGSVLALERGALVGVMQAGAIGR